MKHFLNSTVLAAALMGSTLSHAANREFILNCQWDLSSAEPENSPIYQAVKKVTKNSAGQWESTFWVRVKSGAKTRDHELVSNGEGDEDYLEYKIKSPRSHSGIERAIIQNRFKWVKLTGPDRVSEYDCRP